MDEIGVETESKFFKYVRKFYCAAVEKMIKKFPFHDQTFKSLQLVNPDRKPDLDASMIYQLLSRFPDIIPKELEVKLVDEFMDYRLTPAAELGWDPAGDRDFGKFWGQMKSINDPFSDSPRFGTLARLVQALLVLPNSNADSERAFSIVRKIQTDYRTELGNDTMCALLSCKFNEDSACYSYCPSGSTLKAAKAASMEYNKEHQ